MFIGEYSFVCLFNIRNIDLATNQQSTDIAEVGTFINTDTLAGKSQQLHTITLLGST